MKKINVITILAVILLVVMMPCAVRAVACDIGNAVITTETGAKYEQLGGGAANGGLVTLTVDGREYHCDALSFASALTSGDGTCLGKNDFGENEAFDANYILDDLLTSEDKAEIKAKMLTGGKTPIPETPIAPIVPLAPIELKDISGDSGWSVEGDPWKYRVEYVDGNEIIKACEGTSAQCQDESKWITATGDAADAIKTKDEYKDQYQVAANAAKAEYDVNYAAARAKAQTDQQLAADKQSGTAAAAGKELRGSSTGALAFFKDYNKQFSASAEEETPDQPTQQTYTLLDAHHNPIKEVTAGSAEEAMQQQDLLRKNFAELSPADQEKQRKLMGANANTLLRNTRYASTYTMPSFDEFERNLEQVPMETQEEYDAYRKAHPEMGLPADRSAFEIQGVGNPTGWTQNWNEKDKDGNDKLGADGKPIVKKTFVFDGNGNCVGVDKDNAECIRLQKEYKQYVRKRQGGVDGAMQNAVKGLFNDAIFNPLRRMALSYFKPKHEAKVAQYCIENYLAPMFGDSDFAAGILSGGSESCSPPGVNFTKLPPAAGGFFHWWDCDFSGMFNNPAALFSQATEQLFLASESININGRVIQVDKDEYTYNVVINVVALTDSEWDSYLFNNCTKKKYELESGLKTAYSPNENASTLRYIQKRYIKDLIVPGQNRFNQVCVSKKGASTTSNCVVLAPEEGKFITNEGNGFNC